MNKEAIKNNRLVRKLYYEARGIFSKAKLEKEALKTLDAFGVELPESERKARVRDMIRMDRKYGFTPSEYINYHFEDKTEVERREYVADWEHLGYTCAMNDPRNNELFDNKWETYQRFRKYYKREMLYCASDAAYGDFAAFMDRHQKFVIKPLALSAGRQVQVIDGKDHPDRKSLFDQWMKDYHGRFILEEMIIQSDALGKFHPKSVNTVRMPTIRLDDETIFVHPQLRMGQHDSVVDNAGAGGVKGAIDAATGMLLSAVDGRGHDIIQHPDTGETIVGYQIPHWEEALALARELVNVVPENHYTGWDLALSEDGWVLVEANRRAQFGFQMSYHEGFRQEVNGYLARLGRKY